MSSFCGGSGGIPSMTTSELNEVFPNGYTPDSLPPMENGLADENWLRSYVQSLDKQGRLPKVTQPKEVVTTPFGAPEVKDPLKKFVESENQLQEKLKAEYCFYEKRYFSALDMFLQSVANASLRGQSTNVQEKLNMARRLNQRVTLVTQITNAISKYRYSTSATYQQEINALNKKLEERQRRLQEQRAILVRESAAADVHKRMVEQTKEKNFANQNLLTLYGVLNVVAIGMIVYISRV